MIHQFRKYVTRSGMVAIAIIMGALTATPAGARDRSAPLAGLAAADRALLDVGFRLQASAGDLCTNDVAAIGVTLHDRLQYAAAYRDAAATLFRLGELPGVLAVAADGPAARAGIAVDDGIATVDGVAVPGEGGLARVETVEGMIDVAAARGRVMLGIVRDGRSSDVGIDPVAVCATRFQTVASDELEGRADGRTVEISTGLIAVARSRDELAAIVAHELAHDILGHAERLAREGVSLARHHQDANDAALIRATETEADALSVYLMDRAGYDPRAAITLWRRIMSRPGSHDIESATHGADTDRIARLTTEIARLEAMKAAGQEPRPAFMSPHPPSAPR